ncbi:hypothetical protein Tco_1408498 [Tanacetum coccineum]
MFSLPMEFVVAVARAFYLCVEDFLFILIISGSATWKLQSRLRGEDNLQGFFRPIDHAVGGNVQQKRNMVASAFGEDEGVRSVPRPIRLFYLIASVDSMQGVVDDYRKLAGVKTIAQEGYPQAELSEDP